MGVSVVFLLLATICGLGKVGSSSLSEMLEFLHEMQNPGNCTGLEYVVSDMGTGGGFAAHFQLAASQWMRAAKLVNFEKPVLIMGRIWRYSEGKECKRDGYDWTCFFQPMSLCQKELLKTGKQVGVNVDSIGLDNKLIPEKFQEKGLWRWWGAIQAYMFYRVKPPVLQYVARKAQLAHFPYLTRFNESSLGNIHEYFLPSESGPLAGLHVRHGDKNTDGFKHHSLSAELGHVSKSSECLKDTDSSGAGEGNRGGNDDYKRCIISDSTGVFAPIPVFVASDDPMVVETAQAKGFYTLQARVSQQTGSAGMFSSLGGHPELGYNASLEIIADIYMLSRCTTLVGIASSQIFRMAVDLSKATGQLRHVVAMDYDQLPRMHALSNKYHLPTPERFQPP